MVTMRPTREPGARQRARHRACVAAAQRLPRLVRRACSPPSPPSSCVPRRMRSWTWCRSPRSPTSSPPGSPRPATGSTSSAAASATRCSAGRADRPRLHHRRPPARGARRCSTGWADAVWDTGIAFGTVGARRHGTTVEITTFRADAYDRVTRNPVVAFGETIEDDLVRRDFTVNAMAVELTGGDEGAGSSTRTAGSPRWPPARWTPRPRPRSRSPTTRCGCCGPPGSSPSSASPRRRGCVAAMTAMAGRAGPDHPGAGAGRADQADPRRGTRAAGSSCWSTPAWPSTCCPRCRRCGWRSTSTCSTRTSTRTRWWCSSRRSTARPTGRTSCCGSPRCCTTSASPTTRRKEPDGRVSFHHHEVVGAKLTRRRLRELRYPKAVIDDVAQLVFLHLRFHGYGTGEWTDSAVRRYVTDAGPAAGPAAHARPLRLHHPQPAPRRGAAAQLRLARAADRRPCARRRSSTRSARTSTATRSCSCSGIPPGPAGRARPTSTCSRCGWSAGRWAPTRPRPSCGGGPRRTGSGSPGPRDRRTAFSRCVDQRTGVVQAPTLRSAHRRARRGAAAVVGQQAEQVEPAVAGEQPRGDARRAGLSSAATATAST